MRINRKDFAAGAIFMLFGLSYGVIAWQTLPIGRALNMGPGYFPIMLSGFVAFLGAVIAVRSVVLVEETPFGMVPWRGIIMLSLATIVFAAFLRPLGLLPGVFVTAVVSCLASSQISLRAALLTSAAIAVFCTAIFGYIIKLPVPVFGPFFGA